MKPPPLTHTFPTHRAHVVFTVNVLVRHGEARGGGEELWVGWGRSGEALVVTRTGHCHPRGYRWHKPPCKITLCPGLDGKLLFVRRLRGEFSGQRDLIISNEIRLRAEIFSARKGLRSIAFVTGHRFRNGNSIIARFQFFFFIPVGREIDPPCFSIRSPCSLTSVVLLAGFSVVL